MDVKLNTEACVGDPSVPAVRGEERQENKYLEALGTASLEHSAAAEP